MDKDKLPKLNILGSEEPPMTVEEMEAEFRAKGLEISALDDKIYPEKIDMLVKEQAKLLDEISRKKRLGEDK